MDADEVLKTERAKQSDVRQGSLLHLDPRNAIGDKRRGCCSSAGITSRSTSRSSASAACLRRRLTGAQPALYKANGKTVRPLGAGERQGVRAAERARRGAAEAGDSYVPSRRPRARTRAGRQDDSAGGTQGVGDEREAARHAARSDSEWSGIVHESAAGRAWRRSRRGSNETWFAWSGPTTVAPGRNGTSYYRIQGPNLVIEYAPQPLGGDPSMHIHTMYRDPTNDYGRKATAK